MSTMMSKAKPPKRFRQLSRMDASVSTSFVDDLEYACSGMAAEKEQVRYQSALDVIRLCSDSKARATCFRMHGVLARVLTALGVVAAPTDAAYALALSGILSTLSADGLLLDDDDLVGALMPSVMRHLTACAAAAADGGAGAGSDSMLRSQLASLWRSLQQLCPCKTTICQPAPERRHAAFVAARRLCVLALGSCARASPAACHVARANEALHALPALVDEHTSRPRRAAGPSDAAAEELSVCVELLHATTFASEAAPRGGGAAARGASGRCAPGGRSLDLMPLIRLAEELTRIVYDGDEGEGLLDAAHSKSAGAALPARNGRAADGSPAPRFSPRFSPAARVSPPGAGSGGGPRGESEEDRSGGARHSYEEQRAAARHGFASPSCSMPTGGKARAASCASPVPSSVSVSESSCSGSMYSALGSASARQPRTFSVADRKRRRAEAEAEAAAAAAAKRDGRGRVGGSGAPSPAPLQPVVEDPFAFDGVAPAVVAVSPRAKRLTRPSSSENGPAADADPPAAESYAPTPLAGENGVEDGAEGACPRRALLEHALRAMVNLTHRSPDGCGSLGAHGLPLVVKTIAAELNASEARHGLASHYDCAMMAIGLLINYLEVCAGGASHVGSLPCVVELVDEEAADSGGASSSAPPPPAADAARTIPLVVRLARTLKVLLEPLELSAEETAAAEAAGDEGGEVGGGEAGGASGEAEARQEALERRVMEREVSAAYITLLLGFVCRPDTSHAAAALSALEQPNFGRLGKLLRSFLDLQASAGLIGAESARIMAGLVRWMEQAPAEKGAPA